MNRKQFLAGVLAMVAAPVAAQDFAADGAAVAEEEAGITPESTRKGPRDPHKGAVTNLPIPRFVSLKGSEGNARRGMGAPAVAASSGGRVSCRSASSPLRPYTSVTRGSPGPALIWSAR